MYFFLGGGPCKFTHTHGTNQRKARNDCTSTHGTACVSELCLVNDNSVVTVVTDRQTGTWQGYETDKRNARKGLENEDIKETTLCGVSTGFPLIKMGCQR